MGCLFLCFIGHKRGFILADFLKYHFILWKPPARLPIGIDEVAVEGNLIDSAVPLFQLRLDAEILFDCGRQTGGRRKEASFFAVGNFDIYRSIS